MKKGNLNSSDTATHVYGSIGLVAGGLGLAASYKGTDGILGWLLLAGGWLACAILVWLIFRLSNQLTSIISSHDGEMAEKAERIGNLEATVANLQREIDRRLVTLDYLSSQLMNGPALPRRPGSTPMPTAKKIASQDEGDHE